MLEREIKDLLIAINIQQQRLIKANTSLDIYYHFDPGFMTTRCYYRLTTWEDGKHDTTTLYKKNDLLAKLSLVLDEYKKR